jgi:polyhydroxyalkanoate synthesis repressor PhaR
MSRERVIKRYANRKLYDTMKSRYVTLKGLARMVRDGEELTVIDNESGDDLTAITFAQIILEEEKTRSSLVSVSFLRELIRSGGATVQDISDRATRGIEVLGGITERAGERVRDVVGGGGRALEEGRHLIDDLVARPQEQFKELRSWLRESVDSARSSAVVQRELERVEKSLQSLENAVGMVRSGEDEDDAPAAAAAEEPAGDSPVAQTSGPAGVAPEEPAGGESEGEDSFLDTPAGGKSADR